jgi:hypothetical protein
LLLVVTGSLCAQDPLPTPGVENPALDPVVQRNIQDWAIQQRGLPDDWTHHYLLFSNPGTEQQALESGNYEQWRKIVNDPRFTLQQIKRSAGTKTLEGAGLPAASPPSAEPLGAGAPVQGPGIVWSNGPTRPRTVLKKDWAVPIGGVAASGTGTATTNNASGTSTVTVDGQTLTGSAPTAASASGIFTGAPGAGQGVTITNGSNALKLTTNATTSTVVGTVSAAPSSTTAPTITLTNSAGSSPNTLTLTTNGTGATATGTFSGTGPTNSQTITIENALNSNTLTLTFSTGSATPGTGTVTVSNSIGAANGDTVTIGSVVYTFEETTTAFTGEPFTGAQYYCQNATSPCVWWGTSAANQAQALYAAITNNPAACPTAAEGLYGNWQSTCYSYITAPNPDVTATLANPGTGAAISLINTTGSNVPFLTTSSQGAFALTSTAGAIILGNTSGTGSASFSAVAASGDTITIGATTYTFQTSSLAAVGSVLYGASASDSAANLSAAINDVPAQCANPAGGPCFNVSGANASVGSAASAGVVTVGNLTNATVAWNKSSGAITLSPATIPAPSGSCTSSTSGALNLSPSAATVASYLAAAINSCNGTYSAVGVTANAAAGVVTITDTTPGSYTTLGPLGGNASNFVWSSVTPGTAGTNTCTSSTTGSFATSNSNATVATNIAAAVNACTNSYPAVGLTASSGSAGTFTVTNPIPGPFLAVGASNNTGLFSWGTVTVGSSGTNTCTSSTTGTFATSNSTTTLASNLAASIAACPAAAGVTATSAGAVVAVTARVAGSSGDSIALGNSISNFTWSGADLSGGSDGTTSGTTFAYWSGAAAVSTSQLAANIATAINENTTLKTVVSATSNGNETIVTANTPGTVGNSYGTTVANFAGFAWGAATLTGGTPGAVVQPNMYPAKYSFSLTAASCSDFVVYPTGTAGANGAASIVAFSNLYTGGCSGTVPSVYWGYNTGGMATTSPVFSLDGTQLTFVQVSGTTASLVLLKWSAGSGTPTLPVTPAAATLATYRGCVAPCMVTLAFSGGHNDTYSAPYYDYSDDVAYVGDDNGNLHRFTGLFEGTPAEAGSPWPVNLSASSKLGSPVYDPGTGNAIVGDFGGVLHSVTASSGTVHGTTISVGDAIADAPLLDISAGKLYAFVTTSSYTDIGDNAIYQLPSNFTSITGVNVVPVGTGGAGDYLYSGTFDNVYYSSATPTGNLYTVANTSGTTSGAILYRIPIANSTMGTPVAAVSGLSVAGVRPWPSPLNEFCNNGLSACTSNGTQTTAGTDYIFFSVDRGTGNGCTNTAGNGCVLSYDVSNPAAISRAGSGLNVTTPAGNGCWPTGGIVIDNSVPTSALAGASQTYFIGLGSNTAGGPTGTTQSSSNCAAGTANTIAATQASQSNP